MGTLIIATTGDQARDYARRLLDAAEDPAQVRTVTDVAEGVVGYDVPDEVADAAGFGAAAPDPEPGPDPDAGQSAGEPPARNASREKWAAWLDSQEPPVAYTAEDGRDDLVAIWDAANN